LDAVGESGTGQTFPRQLTTHTRRTTVGAGRRATRAGAQTLIRLALRLDAGQAPSRREKVVPAGDATRVPRRRPDALLCDPLIPLELGRIIEFGDGSLFGGAPP